MADIHLLPFTWNWYVAKHRTDLVAKAVERAKKYRKPIVLFSGGDYAANVPFSGLYIFELSAYRSRRFDNGNRIFAVPAFREDYVSLYCEGRLPLRQKGDRPIVGFCGLAGGEWYRLLWREARLWIQKVAYGLKINDWEPPPFEPTRFRRKVLKYLEDDERIQTNFILRNRYRAGYRAKKKDPFHPTRIEFVRNILDSDYTVAIRGRGNFSVRFYEVLSLGRIPLFVDTDCILPYDHVIDYKEFCVWVDQSDVSRIAEILFQFHMDLSPEQFVDLQLKSRKVWEEYLSRDGFYRHFHEHFPQI